MTRSEKKVERIKKKILELGPMHPGSISEQYTVCGKSGCQCAAPKNPRKHGPYYQLSYTIRGKSSSVFIKKDQLTETRKRVRRYKKFKELCVELTNACVELAKADSFEGKSN